MSDPNLSRIVELGRELESMGCAVVIFTEEELRGARADLVQDRLVELGWDVIDVLAEKPDQDSPTEEDWNWAIK